MKKLIFSLGLVLLFAGCKETPSGPDLRTIYKPLEIRSFTISPDEILRGTSAVLSWQTINAQSVSIDQGVGRVEATGSIKVSPEEGICYSLTARGIKGRASVSVFLSVIQPAACTKISTNYAKSGILGQSVNIGFLGESGGKRYAEEGTRTSR